MSAVGTAPAPESRARIRGLDGLRAIAIISVLLNHGIGYSGPPDSYWFRLALLHADLGVSLFFVISGFLITGLLLREQERCGNISLYGFYGRRSIRILPAFAVYLAALCILSSFGAIQLSDAEIIHSVTYTANFSSIQSWHTGHFWSLSVEEQFYLSWPLLMAFCPRRICIAAAWLAIGIGPSLRILYYLNGVQPIPMKLNFAFPWISAPIAVGCLLAIHADLVRIAIKKSRGLLYLAGPLAMGIDSIWFGRIAILVAVLKSFLLAAFLAQCVFGSGRIAGAVLSNPLVEHIGRMSYSIYLWQQPFFDPKHTLDLWTHFPLNLLAVSVLASASYYLIELPFLRLRSRFENVQMKNAVTGLAPTACAISNSSKRYDAAMLERANDQAAAIDP